MRLKGVPTRVWLIAAGMAAVALLSVPAVLWREGPGAVIPALADGRGIYEEIVPQKLVPLKDNRPWNPNWERWPVANVPRHPLDIVSTQSETQPSLRQWIDGWQCYAWSDEGIPGEHRDALQQILADSGISAFGLLEAGQSFHLAGDDQTAVVWFRAGVLRAEHELTTLTGRDDLLRRRLAEVLVGVQGVMWDAFNSRRFANEGECFERISRMIAALLPCNDDQSRWAMVGVADGLNLQMRHREALEWLAHLGPETSNGMSVEQMAGVSYARGIAYCGLTDYRQAAREFASSMAVTGFQHSRDSRWLYAVCLACLGNRQESLETALEFVKSESMSPEDQYRLLSHIMRILDRGSQHGGG